MIEPLPKLFLDLGERGVERLVLVHLVPFDDPELWFLHRDPPYGRSCSAAMLINVLFLFLLVETP